MPRQPMLTRSLFTGCRGRWPGEWGTRVIAISPGVVHGELRAGHPAEPMMNGTPYGAIADACQQFTSSGFWLSS